MTKLSSSRDINTYVQCHAKDCINTVLARKAHTTINNFYLMFLNPFLSIHFRQVIGLNIIFNITMRRQWPTEHGKELVGNSTLPFFLQVSSIPIIEERWMFNTPFFIGQQLLPSQSNMSPSLIFFVQLCTYVRTVFPRGDYSKVATILLERVCLIK